MNELGNTLAICVVVFACAAVAMSALQRTENTIVALNNAQQKELLEAVSAVGVDVGEVADRVAALVEKNGSADPEVTQAVADLRALGTKLDSIAGEDPSPSPTPTPPPP